MEPGEAASFILREYSKCMSCGFCEAACPTLPFGPHRGYGPRGRVRLASLAVENGSISAEGVAGIYTCLLCAACMLRCPAGVDIVGVVRLARELLARGAIRAPERIPLRLVG